MQDSLVVDTNSDIKKRAVISKIHQKYKGNNFIYTEQSIKEQQQNAWQRFKRWFVDKFKDFFNLKSSNDSISIIAKLMKFMGILFILFILYKIANHFMNDEGSWVFGRKSDKVNIIATDIENDIHSTNFKTLIEEAIQTNNYRLAIRYHYLAALKILSSKEAIAWDFEKTNYDYYNEIKDKTVRKQFQYISYIYDYCWYGEFDIDKNEYLKGTEAFDKLTKMIA